MVNILQSRLVAWIAMALVVGIILFTFSLRPAWWAFFDEFFAFMAVFCQLIAVYSMPKLTYVAQKLQYIGFICLILAILSFIGEYIAWQILS